MWSSHVKHQNGYLSLQNNSYTNQGIIVSKDLIIFRQTINELSRGECSEITFTVTAEEKECLLSLLS